MISGEREAQLTLLVDLSRDIYDAAQIKDWDVVTDLNDRREPLLQAFFENKSSIDESKEIAQSIRAVLLLQKKTLVLCNDQQQANMEQRRALNTGKQATKAYAYHAK